jgi:hypothetical protein
MTWSRTFGRRRSPPSRDDKVAAEQRVSSTATTACLRDSVEACGCELIM